MRKSAHSTFLRLVVIAVLLAGVSLVVGLTGFKFTTEVPTSSAVVSTPKLICTESCSEYNQKWFISQNCDKKVSLKEICASPCVQKDGVFECS